MQIWDVLSNEEAVQIVATAPSRATAARSLVESAVRVWRLKYPTSKVDDCAVVCLYLDRASGEDTSTSLSSENESPSSSPLRRPGVKPEVGIEDASKSRLVQGTRNLSAPESPAEDHKSAQEIGVLEDSKDSKPVEHRRRRSLADWLDADESEGWSALDGITRVNSLLNLPRRLDGNTNRTGGPPLDSQL